jgi:type II secretory pathway pseudopilin PulG
MAIHRQLPLSPRPAFTLVELIVVIGIVLALAALIVLIFPRLQDSQRVAKGADILQGQLFLAKQMALRDQVPRGVRLFGSNGQYTSLQLIEQPLPYSVGQVTGLVPVNPPPPQPPSPYSPPYTLQFSGNSAAVQAQLVNDFANGAIQMGDYINLNFNNPGGDSYTTISPHALHRITANPNSASLTLTISTAPSSSLVNAPNPTLGGVPWNYQVIRSPRAMVGQQPVLLPDSVAITVLNSGPTDILFDPSGVALGSGGVQIPGKVVFLLSDPTGGTPEQMLVAVYTRAGNILAQPLAPGADPQAFLKDGSTSGM